MDINEHLAVNVMGWGPPKSNEPYPYDVDYYPSSPVPRMLVRDWNPRENIEQAIMCLYSFGKLFVCNGFNISGEPGYENFSCWIEDGEEGVQADGHKTLEEAISTAVARATGFEE